MLLCVALLAAGVALPGPARAVDPPQPPPMVPGVVIQPRNVDAAIAAIDSIAATYMKMSGVPGMAVVIVRNGKTVVARGYGVRKAGAPERVDADTVFQIASLSKPVSASVIARRVATGTLSWDTPVVSQLPWFELADPWVSAHVTVGDLLSHRSGLPDHAGDQLEDLGYDQRTILERLRQLPLDPFRASYAYTNFGFTAAAEAAAASAGTDWANLGDQELFKPLGMTASSYRFADFAARPNRAVGHVKIDGHWIPGPERQPDAQAPAGGVTTSATDFGRWMTMILGLGTVNGEEIIPPEALLPAIRAETVSSEVPSPSFRPSTYGYGFGVGVDATGRVELSHSGAFAMGAGTSVRLLPREGIGIAVFTNASPTGAAESVTRSFLDRVEFGVPQREWYADYQPFFEKLMAPVGALVGQAAPSGPVPAPAASWLAGTYHSDYFGDAEIAVAGDGLVLKLGPQQTPHPLAHWDGLVFTFTPRSENAPAGSISQVTFVDSGEAAASAITIELLDAEGMGTFTRP